MKVMIQDARFALRQLRRAPFFTLSALLTLMLSVGATTAMVGILRATLLNPLPFDHAERLIEVADKSLKGLPISGLTSVPRVADLLTVQGSGRALFSKVGFYYSDPSSLTVDGHAPLHVAGVAASGAFFETLGTRALLGRTFTAADDVANGPLLIVLSHAAWVTSFGSDPLIVGRVVKLGADAGTVIGVMPARFDLPAGTTLWHTAHINPATFSGGYRGDAMRWLVVVARLADGQSLAVANSATGALASRLARQYPTTDAAWGFQLTSLRDALFGEYKKALWLLAAAVGLVLLLATINIAGLQLSRNAARGAEFALREALGVTRGRLVRQLLTESLVLVAAGAGLGILLAEGLLRVVVSRLPTALLSIEAPRIDGAGLAMSVGIVFAVGLVTALIPMARSAASMSQRSLAAIGKAGLGAADGRGTRAFGRSFLTLQIALSLVLLTVSASVLGSLYRLLTTPLGFDQVGVQTFSVELPWTTEGAKSTQVQQRAAEAFGAIPGVSAAGGITALPLSPFSFRDSFDIAGRAPTPRHDTIVAEGRSVTPGYLAAMRIPLLEGRIFDERDVQPKAASVVIINRTLANRFFAGRNPIGQRLLNGMGVNGVSSSEIVGVTGDVLGTEGALDTAPEPEIYYPAIGASRLQFALRTSLTAASLEPVIRRIVTSLDGDASISDVKPMTASVERVLRQPKLNATLLSSFAGVSLLLVVIGVYGLMAFEVAQRTRELGLRMALGATRWGVIAMLLTESARVLMAGLVLGVAGGWAAGKVLEAGVPGTTESAAFTFLTTAGILAVAVLAATLGPSLKAARIDPMLALRGE